MLTSWKNGLCLAVVLATVGTASAQPGGKKFEGGRGAPDADRVRNEMKALEGQIDRLSRQIDEIGRKLDRAAPAAPKAAAKAPEGKGKFGPPDGKGFGKKGFERRGEQAKNTPPSAEDWKKAMEEKMKAFRDAKGGPPAGKGPPAMAGRGPGGMGGMGGPWGGPWGGPRAGASGAPQRPAAPSADRVATRAPSSDLEARVNRLERAFEELRREIRSRR